VVKYRFGIPSNIEANGHAWAKITACIDHELTQARGRLKKIVRSPLILTRPCTLTVNDQLKKDTEIADVQSRSTIYKLAKMMTGDENYKITPAICTRVAIMVRSASQCQRRRRLTALDSVNPIFHFLAATFGIKSTTPLVQ
jgi:hypothetical protein